MIEMVKKSFRPLLAVCALGMAFSFNGCSCQVQAGSQPQNTPPPPAPAPAPAPAKPAPALAPPPKKLVIVGRANVEGNRVKIPGELEFDIDKATIDETKPVNKES